MRSSFTLVAAAAIAAVGLTLGGCSTGNGPASSAASARTPAADVSTPSPGLPPASSSAGEATQGSSSPSTSPSASPSASPTAKAKARTASAVENLTVDAATRAQLLKAFASMSTLSASQLRIADLYEAYVPAKNIYWAMALFAPAAADTYTQTLDFQRLPDVGVFARVGEKGLWQTTFGTDPWPCEGAGTAPDDVLRSWGLSATDCAASPTPSPTVAASPDPTRPAANASVPALCTAAPDPYQVTPTAAEEAHAVAMGRSLCGYGVQLGTVWMLENAMSVGGLDERGNGFTYDVQLSYRVGAEYRGIWMMIDRVQPQQGNGHGQPVITRSAAPDTVVTAQWPDGTRVSVDGMVWSPGPGGSAYPLPDPSVLSVIAADPVFDAFADATPPSATPSATPSVTPSATPTATPSVNPSATPTATPSVTPSATP